MVWIGSSASTHNRQLQAITHLLQRRQLEGGAHDGRNGGGGGGHIVVEVDVAEDGHHHLRVCETQLLSVSRTGRHVGEVDHHNMRQLSRQQHLLTQLRNRLASLSRQISAATATRNCVCWPHNPPGSRSDL